MLFFHEYIYIQRERERERERKKEREREGEGGNEVISSFIEMCSVGDFHWNFEVKLEKAREINHKF